MTTGKLMFVAFAVFAAAFTTTGALTIPQGHGQIKKDGETKDAKKYPRGRLAPTKATLDARHARMAKQHDHRIQRLPKVSAADFDCRTLGFVTPVLDQGQCGSCYLISVMGLANTSFKKAGKEDDGGKDIDLAGQYGMDCQNFGGCNGGDEAQVIDFLKTNGFPLTSDYGPYTSGTTGNSGRCQFKAGTKLWKLDDCGYCTPGQEQGIASTDDVKKAVVNYGPVSTAVAANGDWDNYTSGVMPYHPLSPNDVNHAVSIVGWHDDATLKGGGYWIVKNQWSDQWGEQGYAKIQYGSHQMCTEAIFVVVTGTGPLPPPPPPPPPPPGGNDTITVNVGGVVTVYDVFQAGTRKKLQDLIGPIAP